MKIKTYKNIKEAIEDNTEESAEFVFERHTLNKGDRIPTHHHNQANEFIVADNGTFKIILDEEEKEFKLTGQATVIYVPKRKKHALHAMSKISYLVFRDAEDDAIF